MSIAGIIHKPSAKVIENVIEDTNIQHSNTPII